MAETRVRVVDTGEPSYLRRVRVCGKNEREALAALKVKLEAGHGNDLAIKHRSKGTAPTGKTKLGKYVVDVWLPRFEAKVETGKRAPGSAVRYRHAVHHDLVPALGDIPVAKLTRGQLVRLMNRLTPAIAKTNRAILRLALDEAVRDDMVLENVALGLPTIERDVNTPSNELEWSQVLALLAALDTDAIAVRFDVVDVLRFIAGTDVRTSEAVGLAWRHLDLDGSRVTIAATVNANGKRQDNTKTRAGMRTLSLPAEVVAMLRTRWASRSTGVADSAEYPSLVFPAARLGRAAGRAHDVPRWASNFTGQVRAAVDRLIDAGELGGEYAASLQGRYARLLLTPCTTRALHLCRLPTN